MPDTPAIEPTPEALELTRLRSSTSEILQKSATRKARITELEASIETLTTRATDAENRIKALTIDAPVDHLCEEISLAPQALRTAFEADYKIELDKNGSITLLNRADDTPVMKDGKPVPFTPDAMKALLLATKDQSKVALYSAIIVASKASGAASNGNGTQSTRAPKAKQQVSAAFGLR
jgi:hypothetical protein